MSGYFKGATPATSYVDVCGFDPDDRTSVWTWKDSTLLFIHLQSHSVCIPTLLDADNDERLNGARAWWNTALMGT